MGLAWPGKVLTWRRNGCCKGNASFSQFIKFPSSRSAHLIPSPNLLNRRGSPAESELYSLLHEMAYSLRLYNTRNKRKKEIPPMRRSNPLQVNYLCTNSFLSSPLKLKFLCTIPAFPLRKSERKTILQKGKRSGASGLNSFITTMRR